MRNLLRVWAFVGTQFIVSAPAIADAPDTLWTRTYGGTDGDWGFSVQECAEGGFIIAGFTESFGAGKYDVYLIKTDADGDTLWTQTYGGTYYDYSFSVQECAPTKSGQASGGFIIAGRTISFGAGSWDVYLIRTNADGDTLWTKTYGGTDSDVGYSVQECDEGGFIIAGYTWSFSPDTLKEVYLVRTDADGDTLWTKTYEGSGGYSVQECASGGFIIAGETSSSGAGSWDVYLIRTNADGDTLWTKTYGGTGHDCGYSVQECADSGFIITGYTSSFGAGSFDVYLIRTDADGDTLWTKTYGGTYCDEGYSVQECASGGFIIAGVASFSAGSEDVYLIRTDAQGDTLWTKTYGGTDWDYGSSVQECASGGFIIAGVIGRAFGPGDSDVWLIRISETGVEERNERLEIRDWRLEVYPNPSFGKAVIKLSSHPRQIGISALPQQAIKGASIKIYDLSGKLVKTVLTTKQDVEINLEELTNGIYFVRVETNNYKATKKLTILR